MAGDAASIEDRSAGLRPRMGQLFSMLYCQFGEKRAVYLKIIPSVSHS